MTQKLVALLKTQKIQTIAQVILGGIFIFASLGKVFQTEAFGETIANYKILSPSLVKIAAMVLPWVELIFGVLLILNLIPRISASVLSPLLVIFIVAIGINIFRGIDIDCGCILKLMAHSGYSTSDSSIASMWYAIIRDIFLLIPGVVIIFFPSFGRKQGTMNTQPCLNKI
jgi:uncharacterized membrane protein YphA (DoxX/SURF4 family)